MVEEPCDDSRAFDEPRMISTFIVDTLEIWTYHTSGKADFEVV